MLIPWYFRDYFENNVNKNLKRIILIINSKFWEITFNKVKRHRAIAISQLCGSTGLLLNPDRCLSYETIPTRYNLSRTASRNKAQAGEKIAELAISRVAISLSFRKRKKNTLARGNRNEHKSRTAGRNRERFVGRRVRWIEQWPACSGAHSKTRSLVPQSVNLFATLCRIFLYPIVANTLNESDSSVTEKLSIPSTIWNMFERELGRTN